MWFLVILAFADWIVAPSGGQFTQVQNALNAAGPGDRILVRDGVYHEQLVFPASGSPGSPIQIMADSGHAPILDGTGFVGGNMMLIENRSHLEIDGFEIRNLSQINDGSAVRILGSGTHITVRNCHIHHMLGMHAMAITVYGTSATALSQITIEDNWIHDCEPSQSEAITLNGNVDGFTVSGNTVTDVNNIAIDFIGGETSINPNPTLVARNGVCRNNVVRRSRSNYGGGYGAGIYVDGGSDIVIEANDVSQSDLGIEIGAENAGTTTRNIIVRNNWVHQNDKAGLVFGGFDMSVGRVEDCFFVNNTCYLNDTLGEGLGELWIQWASNNVVRNNIFVGRSGETIHYSESGNTANTLDFNLWYATGGQPAWEWRSVHYASYAAFMAGTGQDANGLFADPLLVDPNNGDGHLMVGSPAQDSGDPAASPAVSGTVDFDNNPRFIGVLDRGMDEIFATCMPNVFAQWRSAVSVCGASVLTVRELVGLINQTCVCPTL
ncbi:MAG: right-handed parallel beta-helix repeat-containing protein [Acidobacteria bacterium]|nr:right-handed parallel beta-helix repeat-containing protein [Acidobacteriota bacterium]